MNDKPVLTLFMLSSLDGKISTGDSDEMDVDLDYKNIEGVKEGLHQYYKIEQTTDLHCLLSGAVMTKNCESLDINNRKDQPDKIPVNCIIIDNSHLKQGGIEYLLKKFKTVTIVTKNNNHPAKVFESENLKVIEHENEIDFEGLFRKLKSEYGIERITVQTGAALNAILLRKNLIDKISLVVAPCLVGGINTASLIGGESLHSNGDLKNVKALELKKCATLENSYLHLEYDVIN